jgi:2-(1,2-epoxy-1,2-dihydrophenyl)acetyl-CoA isomerase
MLTEPTEVDGLVCTLDENVLTLRIDRESTLNALTSVQRDAMIELMAGVNLRREVRAVVITGTGRAFCSGADLKAGSGASAQSDPVVGDLQRIVRDGVQRLVTSVLRCEKPVVAAVNGVAAGVGVSLALACDLVVAAEDARFVPAFVRRGLVPDGAATWLLPRLVGVRRAMEMVLLGDAVDAEEGLRLGLINRVVPGPELMDVTRGLATRLANGPTVGMGLTKRLINDSLDQDLHAALRAEAMAVELAGRTEDVREGIEAFRENRPAKFSGR